WSPQGAIDMHRPERWGYVQFSTAAPDQAAYRPDPAGPVRDRLMQIYHAQAAFHGRNKRWAGDLAELGLDGLSPPPSSLFSVRATADGYVASATIGSTGSGGQTLEIRQDSRISRAEGPTR